MSVEVLFLGTCACDFSEKLKGECKDRFDKDARRSSSMLIDGRILIDCGPHTLNAMEIAGVERAQIGDLVLTHLHDDHYDEENVRELAKNRSTPLRIWVKQGANIQVPNGEIIEVEPFKEYSGQGFVLTGLDANHHEDTYPQHLLIEINGKKIFYGCDGAWLLNKTNAYLSEKGVDLAVLECTVGDYVGDYRLGEHNSIPMVRLMMPSLKTTGFLRDDSLVYLSHLAPSLHKSHTETEKITKKFGAIPAYDGLRVEVK